MGNQSWERASRGQKPEAHCGVKETGMLRPLYLFIDSVVGVFFFCVVFISPSDAFSSSSCVVERERQEALQLHVSYHCTFCNKFNSVQIWPWGTKTLKYQMCIIDVLLRFVALAVAWKAVALIAYSEACELCLFIYSCWRGDVRSWRHHPDVIIPHEPAASWFTWCHIAQFVFFFMCVCVSSEKFLWS